MPRFRPGLQPRLGRIKVEVSVPPTHPFPPGRGKVPGDGASTPILPPPTIHPGLSLRRALLKTGAKAGVPWGPRKDSSFPLQREDTELQKEKPSICTLLQQLCLSVAQTQSGLHTYHRLPSLHPSTHIWSQQSAEGSRGPEFPKDAEWRPQVGFGV